MEAAALEDEVERTPDGGVVLDLTPGGPFDLPLEYDDDSPNLVEAFLGAEEGRVALQEIGDTVRKRFDADWDAASPYRQRFAEDTKLYFGDIPPKEFPFKHAANCHVPILLENIIRLVFRTESEVFGDWSNFMGVLPVGPEDRDTAQALTLHGNWQFREKLTDFPREMSRALTFFFMAGDVPGHSYWDPLRRVNVHETLTPDEFVTPYAYKTTRPDYSDLPHYTKVMRRYPHEMRQMADIWVGVEDVIDSKPPSYDADPEDPVREARAKVEDIDKPSISDGAPYKLLWHEGWFMLPGQDKQRFCKVIMDHGSKTILQLAVQEEVNWQERQRFTQQTQEMQQFRAGLSQHQQALGQVQQAQAAVDGLAQQGHMGSMQHQMATQAVGMAQQQVPPPPPQPPWMRSAFDEPKEPRKEPIYMFSHGVCVEPLTGNLGLSFGRILADLNRAADTALSQFTDSATLSNISSFITTENVEFDSPIELKPGAMIKATGVPPGQLEGNIMPLQFQPANQQLVGLVTQMEQWGQASSASNEILSGEPGKSGETARGFMGRLEQAVAQVSVAARRFCMSYLRNVLRNNARLNAIYLDDEEWFNVLNPETGEFELKSTGRDAYQRNYQVCITADLKFTSQAQKVAEADELVQLPSAIPPLQQNLAFQRKAIAEALKARGRTDMLPFLGAAPPMPQMYGEQQVQQMAQQMAQQMVQQMQQGPPPGGPPPGPPQGPPPGAPA